MEFKLNNEQIDEILENYGGTKKTIAKIEKIVNFLEILTDEDEYYEVVAASVSRIESMKISAEAKKAGVERYKTSDIVKYEIIRKFQEKGIEEVTFKEDEETINKK